MPGSLIFVNRYFHPDHSATSQLLSDLTFHLASRGWQVRVLASRQRYDAPNERLPEKELVEGVEVHRLATTKFGRQNLLGRAIDSLTFHLSVWMALRSMASKGTIIVSLTDPPLISWTTSIAVGQRGATLVNWVHDLFPEVAEELGVIGKGGIVARLLRRLRDRSLRVAAMNVALGSGMANVIEGLGARATIVQNWSDGAAIRPVPPSENSLRREMKLTDEFIVGYSGNLGRVHEFETIIEAIERVFEPDEVSADSRIRFVFIGGGPRLDYVRDETGRFGRRVYFLPYQPRARLHESLSLPDVHLVSLRPEIEGLVVPSKFYGIAAAGRPVIFIGSGDGAIARLITEHDCGIAIESGDSDGLADVIRRLADDPDETRRLGMNARAAHEAHWSATIALGKWEELLNRETIQK